MFSFIKHYEVKVLLLLHLLPTCLTTINPTSTGFTCETGNSLLDYGEEDEAYLYLDPKLGNRADPAAARARGPPREVIVFMIGGGCYSEYQNLQV